MYDECHLYKNDETSQGNQDKCACLTVFFSPVVCCYESISRPRLCIRKTYARDWVIKSMITVLCLELHPSSFISFSSRELRSSFSLR